MNHKARAGTATRSDTNAGLELLTLAALSTLVVEPESVRQMFNDTNTETL